MRRLTPFRALVAGLLGFSYVYVGRIGIAIGLFLGTLGIFAIFSWTRLILRVESVYVMLALGLAVALVQIVHPILIAAKQREVPARAYNRWWVYGLWILGSTFACAVIIEIRGFVFGFESYRIPSVAMSPTFEPGDFITVDAWRYGDTEPRVGDIVVFRRDDGVNYVKRIVGVPGDRIEIRQGVVYRNGTPLAEPYLHTPLEGRPFRRDVDPLTLGATEYYVLGDFRDNSRDSRLFGPIHGDQIIGRVEYVWLSASDEGIRWSRFPRYLAYSG